MSKLFKSFTVLGIFICSAFLLVSCSPNSNSGEIKVSEEKTLGGTNILKSIEEFENMGFTPGDSLDLSFSNGFEIKDVPYLTGYYVRIEEPVLVAYPGNSYVVWQYNCGASTWETASLNDDCKVNVSINTKGKYLETEKTLNLKYSNNRKEFSSDTTFANFRALIGGKLQDGKLYRSASPCDNQYNRAPYVNNMIKTIGIAKVYDLSDDADSINTFCADPDFNSPHFENMFVEGYVKALKMNSSFNSDSFKQNLASVIRDMTTSYGKFLICTTEGKERTGFICALFEALAGASYRELERDYMASYESYYNITKSSDKEKYQKIIEIKLYDMLRIISGCDNDTELETADYANGAYNYLKSCGMSDYEITTFKQSICS